MYEAAFASRFKRDLKTCKKRHWDTNAIRMAIADILESDKIPLGPRYKDHALTGKWQGYRAIHVDSVSNPAKNQWVLMYKRQELTIFFVRTGTHEEVYGK